MKQLFWRSKKHILVSVLLILMAASAAIPSPLPVNMVLPEETSIGRPFVVYLSSVDDMREVTLTWGGQTFSVETRLNAGVSEALALLGTDVLKDSPGVMTLGISILVNGKILEFARDIWVKAVDYPAQRLTLPEAMVTPPANLQARLASEREESSRALATMTSSRKWSIPFTRPVPGVITSPYGFRRILNDKPRAPHRGVDYRAREGDPVRAAADGTVVLSADHYYAGECLYIDHGNGVMTVYMHLSSRLVGEGDLVSAGDIIALAGRTGRVTGPHLHFGLSLQGKMVDPEPLLEKSK